MFVNHKQKKVPHHHLLSTNLPSISLLLNMAKGKRWYKFTITVVAVAAALIVVTSAMPPPLPAITAAVQQSSLPGPLSPLLPMPPAAFH
jgi:hypothetical protein